MKEVWRAVIEIRTRNQDPIVIGPFVRYEDGSYSPTSPWEYKYQGPVFKSTRQFVYTLTQP